MNERLPTNSPEPAAADASAPDKAEIDNPKEGATIQNYHENNILSPHYRDASAEGSGDEADGNGPDGTRGADNAHGHSESYDLHAPEGMEFLLMTVRGGLLHAQSGIQWAEETLKTLDKIIARRTKEAQDDPV